MKDSDILRCAAGVVANGFTKDAYARVRGGGVTSPGNPLAECFCMVGATMRAMGADDKRWDSVGDADRLLDQWVVPLLPVRKLHLSTIPGSPRAWNDDPVRTQEDVVNILNLAADVAKSKGE